MNLQREPSGLTWVAFPAAQFGIFSAPRTAPGARPSDRAPTTAAEALEASGALAVLDGPMFERCEGRTYAASTCADLDYLHRAPGLSDPGEHPTRGATLSAWKGGASIAPGAQVDPRAQVAVQLYPALLLDGRNVATDDGTNTDRVWRAGVGLHPRLGVVFAVMPSATMRGFAEALRALGVVSAGYTDGGGSASLLVRGLERVGSSENRRVASWLVALPPSAPAPAGASRLRWLLAGTVLAVPALAWALRRAR